MVVFQPSYSHCSNGLETSSQFSVGNETDILKDWK